MNIGKFAIKNKYLILTILLAIVIVGVYSKNTLQVQLSPDTTPPMATVMTRYFGASSQDVSKDIIEPMEEELGKLEGIVDISSIAQDNIAILQLKFNYGINIDEAAIDIQNSISRIKDKLPNRIDEPRVLKFSTSDKPIMTISLSSSSLSMEKLRQIAEDKISFDIQLVEGVAGTNIYGGYKSEIQVELDSFKMDAYNISLEDISKLLVQNNIKSPGGKLKEDNKEFLIRIEEGFTALDDIEKLQIPTMDGKFIYLKDIGDVRVTFEELESAYKLNGKDSIAILINKRADANTIEVINNLKERLGTLKEEYPFIEFEIAADDSIFTLQMVDNMTSSVFQSILLTVFLIILFIAAINQSIVVSISMPLVFLMTLGLMKISGLKLDLVTLSALILSIGFVVDASIIVVENIVTHNTKYNKDIITATIDATEEIALPSIVGALTTLVVLFPLIFIKGFVGSMFKPLSLTLIYAILSSIFIALTIIPLLTVLMYKIKLNKIEGLIKFLSRPFNRFMDIVLNMYIGILKFALNNKSIIYIILAILMILSGKFLASNGVEMLPKFDSGVTYISIEMEPNAKIQDTKEAVNKIEKYLDKEENIINYDAQIGFEKDNTMLGDFGLMGTNQALMTINLNTRKEREETIWQFQDRLRGYISSIPGIMEFVVKEQGGTATTGSAAPLDISIRGDDQELLYELATKFQEKLNQIEGTTNVYKSFHMDNEQISIYMNNSRVRELGLSSGAVSQQIFNAMEGIKNSTMDIDEFQNLGIHLKYKTESASSIEDLMNIKIRTPQGVTVPLREIGQIEINKRGNMITRQNYKYTIEILSYTDSRAFSHIVSDVQKEINEFPLPKGYSISMIGDQEELSKSMKDMIFSLILSIIFVYLVLVPQFKSFIHPITIMSAIPLVIIGVAPALGLSGKYISMPVLLGTVLLAGTVVNNAILLVEHTNNLRKEGMALEESLIEAVKARYRPIMMTALSDITGMLPLALELALGAERFSPLAIAVIGGMLASTLLTMIIIPVIYASFEKITSIFIKNKKEEGI